MKRNNQPGQILLETVIVLISLAVLAVGSVEIFSNLNRNLISRMQRFQDTRKAAVNSPVFFEEPYGPYSYIAYNPHTRLEVLGDEENSSGYHVPHIPWQDFDDYGDPRLRTALDLIEEAENIIDVTLPDKARQLNGLLPFDAESGNIIDPANLPKSNVEEARNISGYEVGVGMRWDVSVAWGNYNIAADNLRLIINDSENAFPDLNKIQPPPPEMDALRERLREQARERVVRLYDTLRKVILDPPPPPSDPPPAGWPQVSPLYNFLFYTLMPRLEIMETNLNNALAVWDQGCGWVRYSYSCPRQGYLNTATQTLKDILDYMGLSTADAILAQPDPSGNFDLTNKISATRQLLEATTACPPSSVCQSNVSQAITNCDYILANYHYEPPPSGAEEVEDNTTQLVTSAKSDLNNALSHWGDDTREEYLDSARDKLGKIDVTTATQE